LCVTGLAYICYYFIVANLGALVTSNVRYNPPIVALAIGIFLAGEKIEPLAYIAIVLILCGAALLQVGSRRTKA